MSLPRAERLARSRCSISRLHLSLEAQVYHSLVLGVRDYVNKNGFKGVVLGLSGGIDSATDSRDSR